MSANITLSDKEREVIVKRLSNRIEKIGECEIWQGRKDVCFRGKEICIFRVYSYIHRIQMNHRARLYPTCGNQKCVAKYHMRFRSSPKSKEELLKWLQDGAVREGDCLVRRDLALDISGYARTEFLNATISFHRAVFWSASPYETLNDIPKGLVVAHMCRNKTCCNPKHYELVTPSVNIGEHRRRDGTDSNGEKSPNATISLIKAQKIADSWSIIPKLSQQKRADMFGVTRAIVKSIDRRITWRDVVHPNGESYQGTKQTSKQKRVVYTSEEIKQIRDVLEKNSTKIPSKHMSDECWEWQKGMSNDRPVLHIFGERKLAYRYSALVSSGILNDTQHALHSCGYQKCVNPAHLRWGTHLENMADMVRHGTNSHKLTADDVKHIRESKKNYAQIAKEYGVHPVSISKIVRRLTWKDVH